MTKPTRVACVRLTVLVDSAVKWHGVPLYSALVKRCQESDIAGATVISCAEGYGSHRTLHSSRLFALSDNLPMQVQVIERKENLDHLLEVLADMLGQRLVTLEEVEVLHWECAGGHYRAD